MPVIDCWFHEIFYTERTVVARRSTVDGVSFVGGELRGSAAVANGRIETYIIQFDPGPSATQHQATTTHVSSTHKLLRKQEICAKNVDQRIDIFAARNAPEQHNLRTRGQPAGQAMCISTKRFPVSSVVGIDGNCRHFHKVL